MRLIAGCTLAIAFVLWVPSTSFAAPTAEDRITKAAQYVQSQDYKKAVKEYEAAVAAEPMNAKAHLLLGLALANVGDLDRAKAETLASVKIEPSAAGYSNLGLIHANRGELPEANEAFEKSLALNNKSYRTWYQYGQIQNSTGKFDKAIEAYLKATQLNSRFSEAYLGLGSAYYWSGKRDEALKQADSLDKIEKSKAEALREWISKMDAKKNAAAPPAAAAPVAPSPSEPAGKA